MTPRQLTAFDVARLEVTSWTHPMLNAALRANKDPHPTVAMLLVENSDVGHGGHWDETLPDSREAEVTQGLAEHISATFVVSMDEVFALLREIREEWIRRARAAQGSARAAWKREGWAVPKSQSRCPKCGRHIGDADLGSDLAAVEGVETPSGQRWCLSHLLETVDAVDLRSLRDATQ